ncbi:MAG TPA: hypothetical protein VF038_13885 [Usitatibacter sp.]
MPLDLLVPDLLPPPDAPEALREARLPALERWLVRADLERSNAVGAERWLAERFGLASPAPYAAIALAGEEAPRPGAWLRADPVHLRIERDSVVVHDASVLDLDRDEARALAASLQAHFAADGLRFHAPAADRWYVEVPEGELPSTVALEDVRGRDAFGRLPQGGGRINWHSAITEAQMVLASHAVNARREETGMPAVNGVWFWGEGRTPDPLEARYALVKAAGPFARGLARLSGAEVQAPPASLEDVDLVPEGRSALVVLDDLVAPLHRVDLAAWKRAADALDERWFQDLGRAIERFGSVRLVLPRANDTLVAHLGPAARRRWLRRRKPLASHA